MILLVTRHTALIAKLRNTGFEPDCIVEHLTDGDIYKMNRGDIVIGNIPMAFAARLNNIGVGYIGVDLNIPPELRGKELDVVDLENCNIQFHHYRVVEGESPQAMAICEKLNA